MTLGDVEDLLHPHVLVEDGPDVAFAQVVALYRSHRLDGVHPDDDALHFQCGVFDWQDGAGPHFELELTRQVVVQPDGDELSFDLDVQQLSCTFRYAPELFPGVGAEEAWCRDPAEAAAWWARLRTGPALGLARVVRAVSAQVRTGPPA